MTASRAPHQLSSLSMPRPRRRHCHLPHGPSSACAAHGRPSRSPRGHFFYLSFTISMFCSQVSPAQIINLVFRPLEYSVILQPFLRVTSILRSLHCLHLSGVSSSRPPPGVLPVCGGSHRELGDRVVQGAVSPPRQQTARLLRAWERSKPSSLLQDPALEGVPSSSHSRGPFPSAPCPLLTQRVLH